MDLFERYRKAQMEKDSPLAHRMRPRTLDEYVGQRHILAPGRLLRRAIEADQLSSLIFYGPPGTGKTTLAMVIANTTRSHFVTINAVLTGVARLRKEVDDAVKRRGELDRRTTLFVDEVHRWNKAQQDALLPHVEKGTILLIGATTENPYFEVNKALLSRSRIFQLTPLEKHDLREVARAALEDAERGYGNLEGLTVEEEALDHLVDVSNGDARSVLNALELAVETTPPAPDGQVVVDLAVAEESIQRRAVLYDKEGDVHYDTISAFIKSLRGSDPDAALYWMAKMVYAGEDPHFIFRRMAILASEDVGLADPQAAVVVGGLWQIFERVGMPEGRFALSQAALYLATCPKSNSTMAFFDAMKQVREDRDHEVPNPLKDGNRDKEGFGHGKGYLYPHAYRDHWTAQQYLPDGLRGRVFYEPSNQGHEGRLRGDVERRRELQLAELAEGSSAGVAEVLTNSPRDRRREAWLDRATADTAKSLGRIREKVFSRIHPARHHLVLDLNAGGGLLTWEAVRETPEGGVWSLVMRAEQAAILRHHAAQLPELEKPAVMVGPLTQLDALLEERGDEEVRFDFVLGRNLLTMEPSAPQVPSVSDLAKVVKHLRRGGDLLFVQSVPRDGQRLHELVSWEPEDAALREKVAQIEEGLFQDPKDPLLSWRDEDFTARLEEVGLTDLESWRESFRTRKRFARSVVRAWFNQQESQRGQPRYGERLVEGGLDSDELDRVQKLYMQQLADKEHPWRSEVLFIKAKKAKGRKVKGKKPQSTQSKRPSK